MNDLIVNGDFTLQKFPGKGGWTYVDLPAVVPKEKSPFGWVVVSGTIDSYSLYQYKLMPKGKGLLFLPVKAEIRKKINKYAGDNVHIQLYFDSSKPELTSELKRCFENESKEVRIFFDSLTNSEQKAYLDWIRNAKKIETKVERILLMMTKLKNQQKK